MGKTNRRPKQSSAARKTKGAARSKLPPRPKKTIEEIAAEQRSGTSAFFRHRTVDEIAAEQGKGLVTDFDALLGQGADLWKSDEEFEQFLAGIYERRRQGRTA